MFYLNSDELSAYSDEKEILLQDGVEYWVVGYDWVTETIEEQDKTYSKKAANVRLVMGKDKYSSMNKLTRSLKLIIN